MKTLNELQQAYQRLLELSIQQEECLSTGRWETLAPLLEEKGSLLAKANELTGLFKNCGEDKTSSAFQMQLNQVEKTLADLVLVEERCKDMVPCMERHQPKSAAIAAYAHAKNR